MFVPTMLPCEGGSCRGDGRDGVEGAGGEDYRQSSFLRGRQQLRRRHRRSRRPRRRRSVALGTLARLSSASHITVRRTDDLSQRAHRRPDGRSHDGPGRQLRFCFRRGMSCLLCCIATVTVGHCVHHDLLHGLVLVLAVVELLVPIVLACCCALMLRHMEPRRCAILAC